MIAVAAAYTTIPNFPIAALIAAAIATSGDGIFPLLLKIKRCYYYNYCKFSYCFSSGIYCVSTKYLRHIYFLLFFS